MDDARGNGHAGAVGGALLTMYLHWTEKTVTDFSDASVNALYHEGFVFTRLGRGVAHQTRSVRVDLARFELSSENRRVLKKNEHLQGAIEKLPYADYHWQIGKMAKDFYETKFGTGVMSANKVKALLTDPAKSNFNRLLMYAENDSPVGYCIALETDKMIHYSYPFYDINHSIGMWMMIKAVLFAKEQGKKYLYLGSAQRPTDTYKLQFSGLEWFDGKEWQTDTKKLKTILDS